MAVSTAHHALHENLAKAVQQVKASCSGDHDCQKLVSLGDGVLREINLLHPTHEEQPENAQMSEPPKNMKAANSRAKEYFAAARKSAKGGTTSDKYSR